MDIYEQLRRDEGVRAKMYKDSLGIETIGVGHNLRAKGISQNAIDVILMDDIVDVIIDLFKALPWARRLSNARQGVLINMAFNLGVAGLLTFVNTLKAVEEGRWADAARGMLMSKWATQVGSRATRLARQMETDVWQ